MLKILAEGFMGFCAGVGMISIYFDDMQKALSFIGLGIIAGIFLLLKEKDRAVLENCTVFIQNPFDMPDEILNGLENTKTNMEIKPDTKKNNK